jgi:GMP synthase (glutamine-hydrolysing)
MIIHCLQHVPYLGPGAIHHWAVAKGYALSRTPVYRQGTFPDPASFDALVVLSGPSKFFGTEQENLLLCEKRFIARCLHQNKRMLGINLGARLIAEVLGARIYADKVKEIGWYFISWNSNAHRHPMFSFLPARQIVFQWHRDTFELPDGCLPLAGSGCCRNQAFIYQDGVVGFQFHLELGFNNLTQLVRLNKEELKERGPHIQSAEHMLDRPEYLVANNHSLFQFLDLFLACIPTTAPTPLSARLHC